MTIAQAFNQQQPLFIPFIMAGHPTPALTIKALLALEASGADLIELGVPFSDPIADGIVNQQASQCALDQGTTLEIVLQIVQQARRQGCKIPIILFSYLNPILSYGIPAFAEAAIHAGVQGILIVDLPPEEGDTIYPLLQQAGLEIILLISPTTEVARYPLYRHYQPCFLYYISRLSVTGLHQSLASDLEVSLHSLRRHFPQQNIAVGFGVSTITQAACVSQWADGVIIGSLLVHTLATDGLTVFTALAVQLARAIKMGPVHSI